MYIYTQICTYTHTYSAEGAVKRDIQSEVKADDIYAYGVALVSRIDKMIGLFCKRDP